MNNWQETLELAAEQHRSGNLQAAKLLYEDVLKLYPGNIDAEHMLGVIDRAEERYACSLRRLSRVLQARPDFLPIHSNICFAMRQSIDHAESLVLSKNWIELGDICAALSEAFRATASVISQDLYVILFIRYVACAARWRFYTGSVGESCDFIVKSLALLPNYTDTHTVSAELLSEFSHVLDDARDDSTAGGRFAQPVELVTAVARTIAANRKLLSFFLRAGAWSNLETTARSLLLLTPEDSEALYCLGVILDGSGLYSKALQALERVADDHPLSADAMLLAAHAHFGMEDFAAAESTYASAAAHAPGRADIARAAGDGVANCRQHHALRERWPANQRIRLSGRVRIVIVTYNDHASLRRNIDALQTTLENPDITVINNHRDPIDALVPPGIRVLHNALRHPNSTGHLSRSWNQALLFGFGRASAPECDWVIGLQDDLVVRPSLWRLFEAERENFDFMMIGPGDQFWAINMDGLRRIGFWDECFTAIYFQEADYYHRAWLALGERAWLEDHTHQPPGDTLIRTTPLNLRRLLHGAASETEARLLRQPRHGAINRQLAYFQKKWSTPLDCHNFIVSKARAEPAPETHCFYPWFFD